MQTSPELRALAESLAARIRAGCSPEALADDFDELELRLLRAGHAAGLSPVRSYERLPGTDDGHRVLEVLTCPTGVCTRVEPSTADEVPCLVHRRAMAVTRLRS
ncbi:hypothetical protein [Streptomyces sp. NPDC056600]|uniref:hypothetical protein n=1 Tax=Streptomyces sp. NPDC056600 TaxID=3345874 RepID=UPI003676260C